MDAETQQVAEKLARFVAEGGPEVEAIAAERNRDNPAFRSVTEYVNVFPNGNTVFLSLVLLGIFCFVMHLKCNILCSSHSFLYDDQSPAYRYYKEKVQEYVAAASQSSSVPAADSRTDIQQPAAPPLQGIPPPLNPASQPQIQESETPPLKRKRKSRWGSEDDKVELPVPSIVVPQEINVPDPNTPSLSGTWTCVLHTVHVLHKCVHMYVVCLFLQGMKLMNSKSKSSATVVSLCFWSW